MQTSNPATPATPSTLDELSPCCADEIERVRCRECGGSGTETDTDGPYSQTFCCDSCGGWGYLIECLACGKLSVPPAEPFNPAGRI